MSRSQEGVHAPSGLPPSMAEEIRTELERVLSSHLFRSSRRCQSLLRHITEQTLAGDTDVLKERAIGIDVFGRPSNYDTGQDPVVRATAAETRKKLAQYYQENGHDSELRIELIAGSYVPEFHPHTPEPKPVEAVVQPKQDVRISWRVATIALPLLAVIVASYLTVRWHRSDLDLFWAPVLDSSGPVLICIGQPVTYNLVSQDAQDHIQTESTAALSAGASKEAIPKEQLISLPDRYVALGDALSLVHLTALFEKHRKPYRIRGERSTSAADLQESSTVLIAAFDNQWSVHVAGQLRYSFVKDTSSRVEMVRDRLHPEKTDWKLVGAWPKWEIPLDYAIVSPIHDVNTDKPVVIAAGITQYGTTSAGEFLTNPDYFSDAVSELPRDWHKRNVQIVLSVPVVRGSVGHPRVIATHVW